MLMRIENLNMIFDMIHIAHESSLKIMDKLLLVHTKHDDMTITKHNPTKQYAQ